MYAKCSAIGRRELWAKSEALLDLKLPLAGDFNCIVDAEKKIGGLCLRLIKM